MSFSSRYSLNSIVTVCLVVISIFFSVMSLKKIRQVKKTKLMLSELVTQRKTLLFEYQKMKQDGRKDQFLMEQVGVVQHEEQALYEKKQMAETIKSLNMSLKWDIQEMPTVRKNGTICFIFKASAMARSLSEVMNIVYLIDSSEALWFVDSLDLLPGDMSGLKFTMVVKRFFIER